MKPEHLSNRLQSLLRSIDDLSGWVKDARANAPRLDLEADRLLLQLRRAHNQAAAWRNPAQRPAIGFFGCSQSGKSSLIAALAAGGNGRLEAAMGDNRLDVMAHLNPDNQSAGLVMRYSRRAAVPDPAMPVQISLLNESDIVKILALASLLHSPDNSPEPDDLAIDDAVAALAPHRQAEPVTGMTAGQVVALWDFLTRHDSARQQRLAARFWPAAVELAPCLAIDERARLFSLLWGGNEALTAAYRQFAHALLSLSGAEKILAPRSLLVDDTLLPAEGILNALAFADLQTAFDQDIPVRPLSPGRGPEPVSLSLAELNMLAAELLIPLYSAPREALFEQTDILDFPGCAGALDNTPAQGALRAEGFLHPYAESIRQAKSLFLLEDYADRLQNHWLLVCTAAGNRAQAKVVGRSLDYWVRQTRRNYLKPADPRKPGLIWALTAFDQRVTQGRNFDEAVQRAVGKPGESWGTVLAMDDRGIKRMAAHLTSKAAFGPGMGLLEERIRAVTRDIVENLFASWTPLAEKDESAYRQKVAERLLKTLQTRAGVHGEMLEHLLPAREALSRLYLQPQPVPIDNDRQSDSVTPSLETHHPFGIGMEIDLFSELPLAPEAGNAPPAPHETPPSAGYETDYARRVYRHWVNHLRSLPDNPALLALLGMDKAIIELLVAEFITASVRLDIAGTLAARLEDHSVAGLPAGAKACRQVTRVQAVLGDFVAWLGLLESDEALRPDSRVNRGHKIFARPEKQAVNWNTSRRLTKLAPTAPNTTAFYIYDWLVGLQEMILRNAGFAGEGELTANQREQLRQILEELPKDPV